MASKIGAAKGLEPLWQLVLGALSGTRLLHYCINLAVLGGNDPHSYGVTSRRASMNTLGPIFIVKHRACQFRRWGLPSHSRGSFVRIRRRPLGPE